jgi:hypothetical protein
MSVHRVLIYDLQSTHLDQRTGHLHQDQRHGVRHGAAFFATTQAHLRNSNRKRGTNLVPLPFLIRSLGRMSSVFGIYAGVPVNCPSFEACGWLIIPAHCPKAVFGCLPQLN